MSRRDTGFPDEVKALVLMRSDGRCEACGERTGDLQYLGYTPKSEITERPAA